MKRLQPVEPTAATSLSASEADLLGELVESGYVQSFPGKNGTLEELRREQDALQEMLVRDRGEHETRDVTRAAMGDRRRKILDLAERIARVDGSVEFEGQRYALTYRGRTLLSNLLTRLPRVDRMDVSGFERELETLSRSFRLRAAKAKSIFASLKAGFAGMSESDLRSIALGLSAREESEAGLVACFREATTALALGGTRRDDSATLAECIILERGILDSGRLSAACEEIVGFRRTVWEAFASGGDEDPFTPSALLFALDEAKRRALLDDVAAIRDELAAIEGPKPVSLAPIFLVAAAGLARAPGAITRFSRMCDELVARNCPRAEAEMGAAVIVTSDRDPANALRHFEIARDYLSRFSETGFGVPAALLSTLGVSVEESLDDLRLAAAAIGAEGLSPGGFESLSLGLKLLIQTAILVRGTNGSSAPLQVGPEEMAVLAPFGVSALALVLPTALAVLATFHKVSVHRFVTSERAYHPVHTHFIYG